MPGSISLLHADPDAFIRIFGQALYDEYAPLFGLELSPVSLSSVVISADGVTWTFNFSRSVTSDGTGFSGEAATAGAVALTYSSGSGTSSLIFTGDVTVGIGDTATADYDDAVGDVADSDSNELASFTDAVVTNDSEQDLTAPTLLFAMATPDSELVLIFDQNVTGNTGISYTADGGNPTLSNPAAGVSARVIKYDLSRLPAGTEVGTLAASGSDIEAGNGIALADFSGTPVYRLYEFEDGKWMPNPAQNAACVSTQAGDWDDPLTWVGGDVPTASDDVILLHTVTVRDTAAVCRGLLVPSGGKLAFDPTVSTRLTVTTPLFLGTGELEMGTEASPVDAAELCEMVIRDTALPNQYLDPWQVSNGLVMLETSKIRAWGATKTCKASEVRLSVEPEEGHTTLTFETDPLVGWRAGDKLVIPPTEPIRDVASNTAFGVPYEGEEVTIQSVLNNVVTLTGALTMDHLGAYDDNGTLRFLPHVINMTRNVVIRSETEGATVRGHTLFANRVDVGGLAGGPGLGYCLFKNLGRTTDAALNDTTVDADGFLTSYGTNQRGRYPIHFHHWWGPLTDPDVTTVTLGGTPDGGTFRLVYTDGWVRAETANISWDATGATLAANIQAALDALHGVNEVVVTGTGPFTLTSAGTVPQAVSTVNNLTGTAPTVDAGYQGYVEGVAIDDGLKWSLALHEASFLHLVGLNIYDCQYSGIQLEKGNEAFNRIEDCVVMRFVGSSDTISGVDNGITLMEGMDNEIVSNVTAHGHTSVYLPHGIHLDRVRSQPDYELVPKRRTRYRGADVHDGTEGVEYELISYGATSFVCDDNEQYALTKGVSIDHYGGADSATQYITNNRYWAGYQESVFVYGGEIKVIVDTLTVRKVSGFGFWIDTQSENFVELRNGDIQTGPGGFGLTAVGVVHTGGIGVDFGLLVEDTAIIAPVGVRANFPTSAGSGTFFSTYNRVTHLRNVTITTPDGQVTPSYVELGNQPSDPFVGSVVPMLPVQVFIEDCDFDGTPTGNLQAFWTDQDPDADAMCEAEIDPGIFSEYAALTCGLTNAQALATDGRTTGGELMPTDAVTLAGVTGGKVRDRVTGVVAANGTTVTLTFSGEVDTDGTGFSGDGSTTGAFTLAYVSGTGTNEIVFTASETLVTGETVTIDYDDTVGDVAAVTTAWPLPSITALEITNDSEQVGGGFTPANLTGLEIWLQAGPTWCFGSDGTTPCGDTDPVYYWRDQSGNAIDFERTGAGSNQPLLIDAGAGKWVVRFDGTNDEMSNATFNLIDFGQAFILGIGYSGLAASTKGSMYKDGNTNNGIAFGVGDSDLDTNGANLVHLREAIAWVATGLTHNQAGVYVVRSDGTTVRPFRDGNAGSTDTLSDPAIETPTGGTFIGCGNPGNGRFCAVDISAVVLASAENTANQGDLETWLASVQP